jgi:hypothetical protein
MSTEEIEMEWSGLRWLELPVSAGLTGRKTEIRVTMPDGVVIVRDFPLSYSLTAIADFLRRAADAAEVQAIRRPFLDGVREGRKG